MKTYTTIANRMFWTLIVLILMVNFTSCSSQDEDFTTDTSTESISAAQITFTYTVPEDLLRYAEITVCYNNDEGTDAKWEPMLTNKFTLTYNLSKFPVTAPVVFIYDKTNRSAYGVDVNWNITMDVEVAMNIGGQRVTETNTEVYTIDGDLGAAITKLQNNVIDRTFAVKLSKKGDVVFM